MALQTLTSTPGSTPTSTNPPDTNNAFTPAGSPPLILAFLAIGIFSAALISVFGWRRWRFGRAWAIQREREGHGGLGMGMGGPWAENEVAMKKLLERKPRLWDLWTENQDGKWKEVSEGGGKRDWVKIMPLSAKAVQLDGGPPSPTGGPTTTTTARRRTNPPTMGIWLSVRGALRTLSPQSIRRPFLLNRERGRRKPYDQTSVSATPPMLVRTALQVEVAIIMPNARWPLYVRREVLLDGKDDDDDHDHERRQEREERRHVDYVIGSYEHPWDYDDA